MNDEERHEFLRQFEVANLLCPAGAQVCYEAEKLLRGEPNFLDLAVKNYHAAKKASEKIKAAHILPIEQRHQDEKLDTATRLGYPTLDPWVAADKVMAELVELRKLMTSKQNA